MLLKYFYDKALAQASYLVGCAATGEALVIDPARDITPYLAVAKEEGLRITHVTETHIHADYVSGSRELANATGATLFLSAMGGDDWQYAYPPTPFPITPLQDGDTWMVGNIRVEAVHTPGHTPEHLMFLITDTAGADRPIGIFSGDFIFAGDVGRPDLLEEAAGMVGTREIGARLQFRSVERVKALPDYLQVWPGHGAGSACGKALGAIPSTTLGYEKLFNPAFQFTEEQAFVDWLLAGQPEAPRYFAQMKKVNKIAPELVKTLSAPRLGTASELAALLEQEALVIDFRSREAYSQSHALGTLNIPATASNYSTYVGWFVDFEQPLYLIVDTEKEIAGIVKNLQAIGVDHIPAFFTADQLPAPTQTLAETTSDELRSQLNSVVIVDVRGKTEFEEGHIHNAVHIPLGYLPRLSGNLPQDTQIVTHCASGYRSQIAASWLRRAGFSNIVNLVDDTATWSQKLVAKA